MAWESTQPSLLLRIRDPQDQAAWREFDRRYGDLVTNYARRRGLQFSDAEDIRQIVLLNLSRALRSFEYSRERGRFRSYLFRIVQNAISQWLSRPNRSDLALDSFVVSATPSPAEGSERIDEVWEQEWMNHHLRLAMETVRSTFDPKSVAVFDRLLSGQSVEQAAEEFALTAQAVHKIKQRIRDRLRELIAAQIRDEDSADA